VDPGRSEPGRPGRRDRRGPQPGAADPAGAEGALAADPQLGGQHGSGVRPQRTRIVEPCTAPPEGSTVICADELGPAVPRTFPPAPGWSPGGHRVKAPPGVLPRTTEGLGLRRAARRRRAGGHPVRPVSQQPVLPGVPPIGGTSQPRGHDLRGHRQPVQPRQQEHRAWLEGHPRIRHAFLPKRTCWLNLQEGWWRIFRKTALAGQAFADPDEIACATRVATAQLNARARPWIWGRPQPKHRYYRRRFVYAL
jgi:hypothetical protein